MQAAIQRMAEAIAAIVPTHSIWLYGSAVLNDFHLGWSDIDLIVLTRAAITQRQAEQLLTLRQALSAREPGNPYYRCFEGVLVSLEEYRAGRFTRVVYWGTSGQRITDRCDVDAFARQELAFHGRRVYGEGDRSLFSPPSQAELTAAVRRHYEGIRACAVQTDDSLYACGWLLDIARCIYSMRYHDVIAKTRAGEWALAEKIFDDDAALRRALKIRRQPLAYKDRPETKAWLKSLGPTVQRYADALKREWSGINP